jgi:purine-binding chemotaxis protein CheW
MNLNQTEENYLKSIQLVSFSVGKENYGVHIEDVQEIIRMPDITRLPQTEEYIKGIINLRGNIIPIIDMRTRFHMEAKEYTEVTRVIVLSIQNKLVGIVVDSVSKVLELADKEIEDAPEIIHGLAKEYIEGVGKIDESMIIILKADKVLTAEEIKIITEAAEKAMKNKTKKEVH